MRRPSGAGSASCSRPASPYPNTAFSRNACPARIAPQCAPKWAASDAGTRVTIKKSGGRASNVGRLETMSGGGYFGAINHTSSSNPWQNNPAPPVVQVLETLNSQLGSVNHATYRCRSSKCVVIASSQGTVEASNATAVPAAAAAAQAKTMSAGAHQSSQPLLGSSTIGKTDEGSPPGKSVLSFFPLAPLKLKVEHLDVERTDSVATERAECAAAEPPPIPVHHVPSQRLGSDDHRVGRLLPLPLNEVTGGSQSSAQTDRRGHRGRWDSSRDEEQQRNRIGAVSDRWTRPGPRGGDPGLPGNRGGERSERSERSERYARNNRLPTGFATSRRPSYAGNVSTIFARRICIGDSNQPSSQHLPLYRGLRDEGPLRAERRSQLHAGVLARDECLTWRPHVNLNLTKATQWRATVGATSARSTSPSRETFFTEDAIVAAVRSLYADRIRPLLGDVLQRVRAAQQQGRHPWPQQTTRRRDEPATARRTLPRSDPRGEGLQGSQADEYARLASSRSDCPSRLGDACDPAESSRHHSASTDRCPRNGGMLSSRHQRKQYHCDLTNLHDFIVRRCQAKLYIVGSNGESGNAHADSHAFYKQRRETTSVNVLSQREALLKHPPEDFEGWVDPHSPVDPFDLRVWRSLWAFTIWRLGSAANGRLSHGACNVDANGASLMPFQFKGGRYGLAVDLHRSDFPALRELTLGELCHLVQLAIGRGVLAYQRSILQPAAACSLVKPTSPRPSFGEWPQAFPTAGGSEEIDSRASDTSRPFRRKTFADAKSAAAAISSLLIDRPSGILLAQLKKALSMNCDRELLPETFGYRKLTDCLANVQELRDVCEVVCPDPTNHKLLIVHKKYLPLLGQENSRAVRGTTTDADSQQQIGRNAAQSFKSACVGSGPKNGSPRLGPAPAVASQYLRPATADGLGDELAVMYPALLPCTYAHWQMTKPREGQSTARACGLFPYAKRVSSCGDMLPQTAEASFKTKLTIHCGANISRDILAAATPIIAKPVDGFELNDISYPNHMVELQTTPDRDGRASSEAATAPSLTKSCREQVAFFRTCHFANRQSSGVSVYINPEPHLSSDSRSGNLGIELQKKEVQEWTLVTTAASTDENCAGFGFDRTSTACDEWDTLCEKIKEVALNENACRTWDAKELHYSLAVAKSPAHAVFWDCLLPSQNLTCSTKGGSCGSSEKLWSPLCGSVKRGDVRIHREQALSNPPVGDGHEGLALVAFDGFRVPSVVVRTSSVASSPPTHSIVSLKTTLLDRSNDGATSSQPFGPIVHRRTAVGSSTRETSSDMIKFTLGQMFFNGKQGSRKGSIRPRRD